MEPCASPTTEPFRSCRKTQTLIGRRKELQKVQSAIEDKEQSWFIFIMGTGGIGKTRFLEEIKARYAGEPALIVSDIIDFYHSQTHSMVGLLGVLLDKVPGLKAYLEKCYAEQRPGDESGLLRDLALAEHHGLSREEVLARSKNLAKWIGDFAAQQRLVLIFDTAERLVVDDPLRKALDVPPESALVFDWLRDTLLPNLRNTVMLWAGRSEGITLQRSQLDKALTGWQQDSIELPGLTLDEVHRYLHEVQRLNQNQGHVDVAEKIAYLLDNEVWQILFETLQEAGYLKPILLALAIDFVIEKGGEALPLLPATVAGARALSDEQRGQIRENFDRALVEKIMEGITPADELIRQLSWLRKGADAGIFAKLTGKSSEEISPLLQRIRDLTFVKATGEKYFLHDELFDRFARQPLATAVPYDGLIDYYQTRANEAREQLARLYKGGDSAAIAQAHAAFEEALVEEVYYRFKQDPRQGYDWYFAYMQEAATSSNRSLEMYLYAELLAFLRDEPELSANGFRAMAQSDSALRLVKRYVIDWNSAKALEVSKKIEPIVAEPWAKADLHSWRGIALVYQGKLEEAKEEFVRAQQIIEHIEDRESVDKQTSWRHLTIKASLFTHWGYWRRAQGQYRGASEWYDRALALWKQTGIEEETANTLNNSAFVKAELGYFGTALRRAEDALARRKKIGPQKPVGLTLNTLALIYLKNGSYFEAAQYAQEALKIFTELNEQYGQGLALLAYAEIQRRSGEKVGDLTKLKGALESAQKAYDIILSQSASPERRAEAAIELGCVHRDLAKVIRGPNPDKASVTKEVREHAEQSEKYLREAIDAVKDHPHLRYWAVRALVNLAWLYYYVLEDEKAERQVKEAKSLIPLRYHIPLPEDQQRPRAEEAVIPYALELGKAELLLGQVAFNAYKKHKQGRKHDQQEAETFLREAIKHYTLSLAYDTLFLELSTRDSRRGMDRIYANLSTLDKTYVVKLTEEVVRDLGLDENTRMLRFVREDL